LDFLPNHILIVSPVNQGVHFAIVGVSKQDAPFNTLTEKYAGSLRYQLTFRLIAPLAI
jgi:hypothetical protein